MYFSTIENTDVLDMDATITAGIDLFSPLLEASVSGNFVLKDFEKVKNNQPYVLYYN